MAMTVAEIDAAILELETARRARLLGTSVAKTGYGSRSAEFRTATIEELNAEIARLKIARSQLTGEPSGYGPIRIGFGGRP